MSEKHTTLPWSATPAPTNPVYYIFGGTRYIALVGNSDNHDDCDKGNAEFIVRAVNAHYALLEACKEALQAIDECYMETGLVRVATTSKQRQRIEAAIALAQPAEGSEKCT